MKHMSDVTNEQALAHVEQALAHVDDFELKKWGYLEGIQAWAFCADGPDDSTVCAYVFQARHDLSDLPLFANLRRLGWHFHVDSNAASGAMWRVTAGWEKNLDEAKQHAQHMISNHKPWKKREVKK